MNKTRQLRQHLRPLPGLLVKPLLKTLKTNALMHPVFQIGLCCLPEIKIGVEIATHTLYVQERFLQQYQLRLYFNVEATRGLKEPEQHLPQGNLGQRPVEIR